MSNFPTISSDLEKNSVLGLYLLPKGLGLLLALEMLRLWPDLPRLFGATTLLDAEMMTEQQESFGFSIQQIIQYLPYIQIGPWETVHAFSAIYILLGLLMFSGRGRSLPVFGLLLMHYSFFIGNYTWSYGVDYLAQTGLFFSLLFGGRKALQLKRLRLISLGATLFRLQLTFVYFFAGLGKAFGETWWNGEAVWKAIQQPFPSTWFPIPLTAYRYEYLWVLLGIITILLELCYPLVWIKKNIRPLIINGIILMHIGIALTMGLVHFATVMIWYNLCAWNHPLLNIAEPNIKPLEHSKPKLQVPIATETINTKKGGTK